MAKLELEKGYAQVRRLWKPGDTVALDLPMDVQRIEAHPEVKDDAGRVAVQRGPIVYCFEAVDNTVKIERMILARDPQFQPEHRAALLGGVTVLRGRDSAGQEILAVPYTGSECVREVQQSW